MSVARRRTTSRATIEVCQAADSDVLGLVDLLAAVAAEDRWIATQLPFDRAGRAASILDNLRHDGVSVVARSGGSILGEASLRPQRPGLFMLGMAVAAGHRGKGLGSALITPVIAWARERGAHKICLEVFAHNDAAIGLYAKMGFVVEGTFRAHVRRQSGELWDVVAMSLFLNS